jgi:hypothetical protein
LKTKVDRSPDELRKRSLFWFLLIFCAAIPLHSYFLKRRVAKQQDATRPPKFVTHRLGAGRVGSREQQFPDVKDVTMLEVLNMRFTMNAEKGNSQCLNEKISAPRSDLPSNKTRIKRII